MTSATLRPPSMRATSRAAITIAVVVAHACALVILGSDHGAPPLPRIVDVAILLRSLPAPVPSPAPVLARVPAAHEHRAVASLPATQAVTPHEPAAREPSTIAPPLPVSRLAATAAPAAAALAAPTAAALASAVPAPAKSGAGAPVEGPSSPASASSTTDVSTQVGIVCPGYQAIVIAEGVPTQASEAGLRHGRVEVSFAVGPQGQIEGVEVVSSTNPLFNRGARRAVERFHCHGDGKLTRLARLPIVYDIDDDAR